MSLSFCAIYCTLSTLDEFKKAFQERYPVAYDIYDGNKGERLDKWLENVTKSLPKTK